MPVQLEALLYNIILQLYATLYLGHGLDEAGPILLRQSLVAAEAGHHTDVAYVALRVVLGWRCPSRDDIADAAETVLGGVGAEDAEGSADAPLDSLKLTETLPQRGSREGALTFPFIFANTDVQRVVVTNSYGLHIYQPLPPPSSLTPNPSPVGEGNYLEQG